MLLYDWKLIEHPLADTMKYNASNYTRTMYRLQEDRFVYSK